MDDFHKKYHLGIQKPQRNSTVSQRFKCASCIKVSNITISQHWHRKCFHITTPQEINEAHCNTPRSSTVITTVIPLLVIITVDDQAMITFDHSSVSLQP